MKIKKENKKLNNFENLTLIYWMLVTIFVISFYTKDYFLRPTDDAKEVFLYSGCFVFILISLFHFRKKIFSFQIQFLNKLDLLFASFFVFGLLNALVVSPSWFLSFDVLGKLALLYVCIRILSALNLNLALNWGVFLAFFGTAVLIYSFEFEKRNHILPIGHISYYSDFVFIILSWLFFSFFYLKNKIFKIMIAGFIVFLMSLIWIAAGRTTLGEVFISFLLVGIFILWYIYKRKISKKGIIHLVVFVFVFCVCGYISQSIFSVSFRNQAISERLEAVTSNEISTNKLENHILGARHSIYKRSVQAFLEKPFTGWGLGNFKFVYPHFVEKDDFEKSILGRESKFWLMHPHNETINSLFEMGISSLIFIILFIILAYRGFREKINSTNFLESKIAIFLLVSLTSVVLGFHLTTSFQNPLIRLSLIPHAVLLFKFLDEKIEFNSGFLNHAVLKTGVIALVLYVCLSPLRGLLSSHYLQMAKKTAYIKENPQIVNYVSRLSPNTFDTLYYGALINFATNQKQQSIEFLKTAVERYPYIVLIYRELYYQLNEAGKIDEAEKYLNKGITLFPNYENLLEIKKNLDNQKKSGTNFKS